jgi:hypothetical protein
MVRFTMIEEKNRHVLMPYGRVVRTVKACRYGRRPIVDCFEGQTEHPLRKAKKIGFCIYIL